MDINQIFAKENCKLIVEDKVVKPDAIVLRDVRLADKCKVCGTRGNRKIYHNFLNYFFSLVEHFVEGCIETDREKDNFVEEIDQKFNIFLKCDQIYQFLMNFFSGKY